MIGSASGAHGRVAVVLAGLLGLLVACGTATSSPSATSTETGAWIPFEVADGEAYDIALVSLDSELVRPTDSGAAWMPSWRPTGLDE